MSTIDPTIPMGPDEHDLEPAPSRPPRPSDEDGSLITEYGLLAVVAATIAAAVIQWASDGALSTLFNALMRSARDIVGA
jgi:Flp pilus assembly pilin Flp